MSFAPASCPECGARRWTLSSLRKILYCGKCKFAVGVVDEETGELVEPVEGELEGEQVQRRLFN